MTTCSPGSPSAIVGIRSLDSGTCKPSALTTRGCNWCNRCAPADTEKPSANGRVIAAPPTSSFASRTSTDLPAFASNAAQTRPLWPAPMMIASYRSVLTGPLRS